jgi:hypothetical protein
MALTNLQLVMIRLATLLLTWTPVIFTRLGGKSIFIVLQFI